MLTPMHLCPKCNPGQCGMPHDVGYVREAVFKQEGNPCYCKKRVRAVWLPTGLARGVVTCPPLAGELGFQGVAGVLPHRSTVLRPASKCYRPPAASPVCNLLPSFNLPPQSCGGLVKPDIVFFGESLPERFWER